VINSEYFKFYLIQHYPNVKSFLDYFDINSHIIAVSLSAQTKDSLVNSVLKKLFSCYSTIDEIAKASLADITTMLKPLGLNNVKAQRLIAQCQILSKFPVLLTREYLQSLPGVGRKTANIILSAHGISEELGVDTHILRVATRLGICDKSDSLLVVENKLKEYLVKDLYSWHLRIILFGREICLSRKPKCNICPFSKECKYLNFSKNY